MEPTASIIILSYNGCRYLDDCFRALFAETQGKHEVIVVDNASTDGSADYIESQWPNVRLIRSITNLGFAAGCNRGAEFATGKYLVFLNQDTRVQPGWLAGLLAPLENDPQVGMTTSRVLLMSQPGKIHTCGQEIHFTGLSFARGILRDGETLAEQAVVDAVNGASFAIRSDEWKRLGGFDETYFMWYEETDLSWRVYLSGSTCLYVPGSLLYHDYKLQSSMFALSYTTRNRYLMLLKNWSLRTLVFIFPSLLITEIIDLVYLVRFGRQGIAMKLQAWHWVFTHFAAIRKMRASSRSIRTRSDRYLLEHCTAQINPQIFTGGWLGRLLISAVNIFFQFNYALVYFLSH